MTKSTAARYYGPAIILALLCSVAAYADPLPLQTQPVDDPALHDPDLATPAAALPASVARSRAGEVATEVRVLRDNGCEPHWETQIFVPQGIRGTVEDIIEFDDGTGSAIYAVGSFQINRDGVYCRNSSSFYPPCDNIMRWDGSRWSTIPGSPSGESFSKLAVVTLDGVPTLFVGGDSLHTWNGSFWLSFEGISNIESFGVYDDGSGEALYVMAYFTNIEGFTTGDNLAKWDGQSWSVIAGYPGTGHIFSMAVFDDGSGASLYVAGSGTPAGPNDVYIAKWTGTMWVPVGGGTNARVDDMAVFPINGVDHLVAVGPFNEAGGSAVSRGVALWDGSQWSSLGIGFLNGAPSNIEVAQLAGDPEPRLFVSGLFSVADGEPVEWAATWNGTKWVEFGDFSGTVKDLLAVDDWQGAGPRLFAAGSFSLVSGLYCNGIVEWDAQSWYPMGGDGIVSSVSTVYSLQDPALGGPALVASGADLFTAGGIPVNRVAILGHDGWAPMGLGFNSPVNAFLVHDFGAGPMLYAGGSLRFYSNGEAINRGFMQWDGYTWSAPPGGSVGGEITDMVIFDDGDGERLFAGGQFTNVGDASYARHIAKWDGTTWSVVTLDGFNSRVEALAVYDDGSGPALYAGGQFTRVTRANGTFLENLGYIARWDGTDWTKVGDGLPDRVFALEVFDPGSGPVLVAGGPFTVENGGNPLAWDGVTWTVLGENRLSSRVLDFAAYDFGSGQRLVATGQFRHASDINVNGIAVLEGNEWVPYGDGLQVSPPAMPTASTGGLSLAVHDDGYAKHLYVGGNFDMAGGIYTGGGLSRLTGCKPDLLPNCPGDINGDGFVNLDDFIILAANFGAGPGATPAQGDLNQDGFVDLDDFIILAAHFGANCTE